MYIGHNVCGEYVLPGHKRQVSSSNASSLSFLLAACLNQNKAGSDVGNDGT